MATRNLTVTPIGVIKTPHKSKYSAPRQPASAAAHSIGVITLSPEMNFEQALEDLEGFDYVWILFWFHKNNNWKPKVLPPHGERTKRGLFSTRSPHRPNPIGLSLCKLLGVKGRTLRIENPDMLDGTPILDIKPYIPHAEAFPEARSGWITRLNEQMPPRYVVQFAPELGPELKDLHDKEPQEILTYLTALLSSDPFPHSYRRIKAHSDGTFIIAVKRWRFRYTIENFKVNIFGVARDRGKSTKS